MDDKPVLNLQLNPNGVSAPAQRAVVVASQVVAITLRALAKDDLSEPEIQSGFMGYRFNGIDWSDSERRQTFENWILSKGFQDLARGVRETLEEAAFYLDIITIGSGFTTISEINHKMESAREKAASLKFPDLLAKVNKRLTEELAFESEFLSLQRVRNCLEHRGGKVGPKDIDPKSGKMVLTFPRLRTFYMRRGEEIEVAAGEPIDTYNIDREDDSEEEITIFMGRATRSYEYSLGDPVVITAEQFIEIAMACHLFAADLASKLPTLPQPSGSS